MPIAITRRAPVSCARRPAPKSTPDARTLTDVPAEIRAGADLVLDGGDLPGTPSTVVDLRAYETAASWEVLRAGAVDRARLAAVLGGGDRPAGYGWTKVSGSGPRRRP